MTDERIQSTISIINYAIENDISAWDASKEKGYSNSYVKNVKAKLIEDYGKGLIDEGIYARFMEAWAKYVDFQSSSKSEKGNNKEVQGNTEKTPETGEKLNFQVNGNTADVNWQGNQKHFDNMFNLPEEEKPPYEPNRHWGYPEGHIKTLDNLLDKCDVDREIWDVENFLINKWDVTSYYDGEPSTWENFQVKARLKLKKAQAKAKTAAEIFNRMINVYTPPVLDSEVCKGVDKSENNVLEVALFDMHYGKLAWNGETGENYDTKIAKKRFEYAMRKIIQRAMGFPFKRILFPIGNDFFNSDNSQNTTTHGTPQDEDLRWQKTFESGCELIVDGINMLKQLGVPIDVIIIPGNHDFERSFYLGSFISAWFRNDTQVNINNEAKPRKYYVWGKVLLGFTHGRHEKENSLPMLMAKDKDSKKYWTDTDFHEWHLGHFHRKKTKQYTVLDKTNYVDEEDGVIVRYLSSLTGTEEWHFLKGFVGQIKAAEAFIWNDKTGMIGHINSNYIFEGSVEEENDVDELLKM